MCHICRLIEEVREKAGVTLETDDVYMSTTFGAFIHTMISKSRGGDAVELEYDAVSSVVLLAIQNLRAQASSKF